MLVLTRVEQEWFSAKPFDEWDVEDPAALQTLLSQMDPSCGDRRQEIVVIERSMDSAAMKAAMEEALTREEELHGTASCYVFVV
jgi:hypothetical protein